MKRTHRVHRMQRLRLSISVGPKSTSARTPSPSKVRRGNSIRLSCRAEAVGEVLQRALAALVADRAVQRVVDEQELEDARPGLDHLGRVGVDDHALGRDDRARHLELRHLLDLHEADAARAVHAKAGVVAVVGQPDAGLDGGLQDGLALRDGELTAVDREGDGIHSLPILADRPRGLSVRRPVVCRGRWRPAGAAGHAIGPRTRKWRGRRGPRSPAQLSQRAPDRHHALLVGGRHAHQHVLRSTRRRSAP